MTQGAPRRMRVAVCTGPRQIEIRERPPPEVNAGKVLVRVTLCALCGSDLHVWRGSGYRQYPYSPGHEFGGVIEEAGKASGGLAPGQRVVVDPNLGCGDCEFCERGRPNLCPRLKTRPVKSNGGLADYVALDHRMVHPLPDELPDELSHYVEPLSCALHMVHTADPDPGARVLVFGAGSTGKLVGAALSLSGIQPVFVELSDRRRREVTRLFGAEALSPQELDASGFAGEVEAAIECTGSAAAVAQAIRSLRKGGRLVVAGLFGESDRGDIPLDEITTKELEIVGAWLNPGTFVKALEMAVQLRDLLSDIDTEVFPLDEVAKAFERAALPEAPKVLVRP